MPTQSSQPETGRGRGDTRPPDGNTGKNTGKLAAPWKPGQSGNLSGRPKGDALMRKLLDESFQLSRKEAIAALCRRWASTRYVQEMVEIKARLDGELSKDGQEGGRGVQITLLNNQGKHPLDPEVFREAAPRKTLETRSTSPTSSSGRPDP